MLKINYESNQSPEMTFVKGEYFNKKFEMNYYLNGSYKIYGNFSDLEKESLINEYVMMF